MNDFIFNFPPLKDTSILFGFPWDAFLPPLVGSFLGVIAGFGINYANQSYNIYKNKIKIKNMIRSEIVLCITELELDIVHLLQTDSWNSAVSSGALALLEVETELKPLSIVYLRIQDYNNIANGRYGEIGFIDNKWAQIDAEAGTYPAVRQLKSSREWLLGELRSLKEKGWLKQASAPITRVDRLWQFWWQWWN